MDPESILSPEELRHFSQKCDSQQLDELIRKLSLEISSPELGLAAEDADAVRSNGMRSIADMLHDPGCLVSSLDEDCLARIGEALERIGLDWNFLSLPQSQN